MGVAYGRHEAPTAFLSSLGLLLWHCAFIRLYIICESGDQPFHSHHSRSEQKEALLLTLLSFANISELPVPIPQWEFFSQSQIEQVLSKCERSVSTGLKLVDVKQLHHILMDELFAVQSTATAVQRQLFLQETEKILTYALKYNNHRSYTTSTVEYMDAWRQVMEVLCAVTPPDIFPVDPRMILLLEIIHVLLKKVVTVDNVAAELAVKCSGMVMIMMVNLRHSLVLKTKQEKMHKDVPEHQLEIDSRKKCDLKSENNMSTLRIILSNIIKWILSSSGLLDKPQAGPNDNTSLNCLDSSRHHISLTKINSDQRVPTMEILVSAGECLLQFLCLDCIGGHNICK
ncbi:unnamed protein product, partial [Timema podura]|nr:unnamed protein product [Timema podura]